MIWKFFLYLSFMAFVNAKCTPQGCGCRRPACSSPPASPPVVPILLDNCGPDPSPLPPINAPPVQTPLVNKPPINLPANVPPPKTIANTCHCVKTVVKPQVLQQLITVPSVQRYIQTSHTPVVEHIHYHGVPINCPPYTPDSDEAAPACSQPSCLPSPVPPCLPVAPPPQTPALPPSLILAALLSALTGAAPSAPCPLPPAPLSPTLSLQLPALPPPVLPPCSPPTPSSLILPPCSPPSPPTLTLPPCLLSLLSKLC